MTVLSGVDVASFQHPHGDELEIDWPEVAAAGVRFAWVKATEGNTYHNPFFAVDTAHAAAAGIARGGYHFARPDETPADVQAQHFRAICGRLDLPAALDAEAHWLASAQANTDWCLRWLDSVGEQHRVIYTNADGALVHLDSNRLTANGVDLWYAHPGVPDDDFRGVGAWGQASVLQNGQGSWPGIPAPVDLDHMTPATFDRYTGATPPAPHPPDDHQELKPMEPILGPDGAIHVFVIGTDSHIYESVKPPGGVWGDWTPVIGPNGEPGTVRAPA